MNEFQQGRLKDDWCKTLKTAAMDLGMFNSDVSKKARLSIDWVNKIMNGHLGCSVKALQAVCKAVKVNFQDIIQH